MHYRSAIASGLLALTAASQCLAWNALGHKTIAEIAWRQLSPEQRQSIVDTLRRHPRFDEDFARQMTDDILQADKATQDHWVFQQAATWADIIRGNKEYDRPSWHYVDFPLYLDPADRVLAPKLTFNRSTDYPTRLDEKKYNLFQAMAHCRKAIESKAGPDVKAVAYCWIFHLVGDCHQPLHSTALVSVDKFPKGDRGGNEITLSRGRNLHSLWDNLLGRQYFMRDVDRTVHELSDRGLYSDVWDNAAQETEVRKWVAESHDLAKSVYTTGVLEAIRNAPMAPKPERERRRTPSASSNGSEQALAAIDVPESYMQEAGKVARRRIIAAGIRLGGILDKVSSTTELKSAGQ